MRIRKVTHKNIIHFPLGSVKHNLLSVVRSVSWLVHLSPLKCEHINNVLRTGSRRQNQVDKMGQNELMPELNGEFSCRVLASTDDQLDPVYVRRDGEQGVGFHGFFTVNPVPYLVLWRQFDAVHQ